MDFHANAPIYLQLMETVKQQIASGILKPGDKLASVRELALEYGVNPNTMQKALSELEWEKLVYTMRTSGRFVTEDIGVITAMKEELINEKISQFVKDIEALGYEQDRVFELLEQWREKNPTQEGDMML